MVDFLTIEQDTDLYKFIRVDLSNKYGQRINIEEVKIVKDTLLGDKIVDAIKITYFPSETKVENIDNKISADICRYNYENDLGLVRNMGIEKDVWLGEIRYSLVYTYAGDWVNCDKCRRLCKKDDEIRCDYFEAEV